MPRTPALALLLLGCAGGPLDDDFHATLTERGNCGWVLEAWSADADAMLRFHLDPSQWGQVDVGEVGEATFEYPRSAWTDQEGDLEVLAGGTLGDSCLTELAPSTRYLPGEGRATIRIAPTYYDVDDEGCTVARGQVGVDLTGLLMRDLEGNADSLLPPDFSVTGEVEVLEGCSF